MEIRQVKRRNLLAYGFGEFYGGGSFVVISLLFMFFLTDVVKLSPALAGLVVLVGKFWDAISDPLMGYISDNMRTRFGRRRIFFLIGIIPVAVTFTILWISMQFPSDYATFAYYSISYVLFSTIFTMVMIPYRALNAEMTYDYAVRTRLTGVKMIFSQVSSLICATVPKLIVDRLYPGDPEKGFMVMGIIFGLFFALPWIIVYVGTWEIATTDGGDWAGINFLKGFLSLFKNRSYRIQMGLYISAYSALDLLMAMFIYYLTYYILRPEIYSLCLGAMFVTSISVMAAYVYLANKRGKGFAFIVGLVIWGTGMLLSLLLSSSTPTWMIVALTMLIGLGLSSGVLMPWAMLPSIIDVDELITGKQRAGICSGAMTLLRKIVQSFVLFLFGVLLELIGYVPSVPQQPHTLFWIKVTFFLAPSILIILGILFASRFGITPKTHALLKDELERLRSGGRKDEVEPATKIVCETLSGLPYEKLFPRGKKE